jgi:signal transduction histidine kinase
LSAILIGILISTIGGLINFILSSSAISVIIPLLLSVSLVVIYYFVRFKKLVTPFATPVIIAAIFGIAAIWVFNGGINGSNIMPAFLILILGILVVPTRNKKYIITLFIAVNIIILLIQYYRPDLIIEFPSEKVRWVDNLVTFIYSSFFIYLIINFTHKHYTLERLKAERSEKRLHQLNADKDRFISILGHDLKNPLIALVELSEVLKKDLRKRDFDEIEIFVNQINSTAQNTSNFLEDLLIWAKTQQGSISFKPQLVKLRDLCLGTIEILVPNARAKNITLNYSVTNEIDIFADVDMLKTILRNLVSNAIKFTNNSGKIEITAEKNPANVKITVSDTGVGISEKNLVKLFDIKEVLSTKGTAGEQGSGLGLLICKEFVEAHGGKIWVESTPGEGTSFHFIIPSNSEPKESNILSNVVGDS